MLKMCFPRELYNYEYIIIIGKNHSKCANLKWKSNLANERMSYRFEAE